MAKKRSKSQKRAKKTDGAFESNLNEDKQKEAPPENATQLSKEPGEEETLEQIDPLEQQEAEPPPVEQERKPYTSFIWYESESPAGKGIAFTTEVWDKGMTVETPKELSVGTHLQIELRQGTMIVKEKAHVASSDLIGPVFKSTLELV